MPETSMPSFVSNPSLANQLRDIASQCLRDIGLGYRESTWIGLMTAALRAEGIPFVVNPVTTIPSCGDTTLRCLVINGQCAITITALGHEITATDRAKAQTCLRWLGLPWGLAFHFGKEAVDLKFVSAPR